MAEQPIVVDSATGGVKGKTVTDFKTLLAYKLNEPSAPDGAVAMGSQQITELASGGSTSTNAANIGDIGATAPAGHGSTHSPGGSDPIPSLAPVAPFVGDGSDGNVTISGTTTLTQDMFYNTLTVANGGILKTNGWRVYCKTACNVNSGGSINADGNSGSGSSAGGNITAQTLGQSTSGGAGNTGSGSTGASNSSNALGGAGGRGGAGTGTTSGGGSVGAPGASSGSLRALPMAALGWEAGGSGGWSRINGGAGGGGGGGDATNSGGGGGAGGGVLVLNARAVTNNGTISANGGTGATQSTGNVGGGGGGGGGLVIVNCGSYTGTAPTANGGTFGSGHGTGTAGLAGSAGVVFNNVWT